MGGQLPADALGHAGDGAGDPAAGHCYLHAGGALEPHGDGGDRCATRAQEAGPAAAQAATSPSHAAAMRAPLAEWALV